MSINLNISDFSADFFTLDQENKPADAVQFLKGLDVLASRSLDALSQPEDVELAFQRIENANLIELGSEDKTNVDQRMQDVFRNWVNVRFGGHTRHVPRKRLAEQCGPKFKAQYTSVMKEALDRELDLQSGDTSPTGGYPEDCKELLLVYLQTGALPPDALGDNALNMLVLAEQHQLEELAQECVDFLIDNLSIENLDTFLEFTKQTYCPLLEFACLNFMQADPYLISEELKTKYQEKLSIVEELLDRGKITLELSSSGKTEAIVKPFTKQPADLLLKINQQFPITSLFLRGETRNDLYHSLEQIAPNLEHLQELCIWDETPTDSDLATINRLLPNLKSLGNDAPFLKTFDEVKTYVKNFRKPGEEDQESKKPLLLSLNLRAVPNLTDAQLAELSQYLQELVHLFIKSDSITSVVAPKATWVRCFGCTALTTLEAPEAIAIDCKDLTKLATLKAPKATSVNCDGCTSLITLIALKATWIDCSSCSKLATLHAPNATEVYCNCCTALTTLEAPKATGVECRGCTQLTTLKATKATGINCCHCTALPTLKVPKATKVVCAECRALTTLEVPSATEVNCESCTQLTTLKAPKAASVICLRCTALTTLEALEATHVNCYGCCKLASLEAPKASWVSCKGCTALTTLKAPSATSVNCWDCTALTILEVPKATEVSYNGCTSLTTLEVLKQISLADQNKFV